MRGYIWTDKSLTRHAGRFVWLSLDMEKAQNAPARKQLGIVAFPTYYVVDPSDGHVALRWLGGASLKQLDRLFDDGELAVKGGAKGPAFEALIAADRAYGAEKPAEACDLFLRALAAAPEDWPVYGRAVESLMFAYYEADSTLSTLRLADRAWPRVRGTPSATVVAASALDAASSLPDTVPGRDAWIAKYEAACHEVLSDPGIPLVGDDRSGVYFSLEAAREALGDDAGVRRLQEEHLAMLEREAANAATPEQRSAYDSHRISLYLALDRPEKALPMVEQTQRDFPDDYNPLARKAAAYKAMKKWPEALAAADAAMKLAYGPRQFLVLNTKADIQLGMADTTAARATLVDALARAEKMPEGLRSTRTIASLKGRIEKLGGMPAVPEGGSSR